MGARDLRDLPDALAILVRRGGLFDQNEALQANVFEDRAETSSPDTGRRGGKGIAIHRNRHIVTWLPLPAGDLGSVFDEEDVKNRLIALLALHANTGMLQGAIVALAVSVEPVSMLLLGKAGDTERRTSAQFLFTMKPNASLRIEPTSSVEAIALTSHAVEIADELVAQLALRLQSLR